MKKVWILIIFGISTLAYGKELDSFSKVSKSIMGGNNIRVVIQSNSCDSGKSALSFFTEANSVILRPTYLQFANTHLTTNHPGFEKIPVLENVTYRISNDGEVRIMTRLITLPDYQVKDEHVMICVLGHSAKIYIDD